jgi:Uma2 family endonuclease
VKVGLPAKKDDRIYRYGDYRQWPEDERWELIGGVAWNMSPAPSMAHQALVTELLHALRAFLGKAGCRVFAAPFDVLLPDRDGQQADDVRNVVQPDVAVVCDPSRLRAYGCFGAPDLVVEILSPYTSRRDMVEKLRLYERHGVVEYWVIDPGNRYIHVYVRGSNSVYPDPQLYVGSSIIASQACPGFQLDVESFFASVPGV